MGCDIHMSLEERIDGQWCYIRDVDVGRCYELFALLADVRNRHGIKPIAPPRGVPPDASPVYRREARLQAENGYHSFSWVTHEDVEAVMQSKTYTDECGDVETYGSLLARLPSLSEDQRLVFYFDS